ncbi:alpha/beta fold hydrolase [Nocardioides jejuensis]|uniref:Alpha/beta fold hydrolase n=1 Tax=Nocardioides jejuensis TaxID=2502782 RepID=A0A4R1BZD3_9ACTN|nr:alpha/beta fold hydrolase [Nocardioides jejuensis]TCJ22725.1 alpha/beta fold hydrolase [Nocardioides jejuensis]
MTTASRLSINGLSIPVAQAGSTDGAEAVVFIHGNSGAIADWLPFLEPVGTFTRAVAFDLPGYGGADKPSGFDYTAGGYAEFIDATLKALGIRSAHIVAHDLGGGWAMRWAADHPEQFASATLINTGVLLDYEWHDAAKLWRQPEVGEAIQAGMTRDLFLEVVSAQNPRLGPAALEALWQQTDNPGTNHAVLQFYRATSEATLAEPQAVLRGLDRPALVIWGEDDAYIPVSQALLQRESFPSAQVMVLPDAGHWVTLEDPDTVRELIVPFLRQHVGFTGPSSE